MNASACKLQSFDHSHSNRSKHPAPYVKKGAIKSFLSLRGKSIACFSGRLWVTVEGDFMDYVLVPGEQLTILDAGKVLLSGPGRYLISRVADEEMTEHFAATGS